MDDKLILHGIYSLRDTKSNINHFYAIILSKNENDDYDTYVLECAGYPNNKLEVRYSFLEKHVDGYLGQTSLQLHDNLFDVYKYKSKN